MPWISSVSRWVSKEDKVDGSNEMARAIWALGRIGEKATAASIARYVRSKSEINWEGPQASRFFRRRRRRKDPHFFFHLQPNGRYIYSLSRLGQDVYTSLFVTKGKPYSERPVYRDKNRRSEVIIKHLQDDVRARDELIVRMNKKIVLQLDLLRRIHAGLSGDIMQTMDDVSAHLKSDGQNEG